VNDDLNEPLLGRNNSINRSAEMRQRMNFAELRQNQNRQRDAEFDVLKRDVASDLIFNALISSLIYYLGRDSECGIPIMRWNLIYFVFLSFRSCSSLIKHYVNRDYY